MGFTGPLGDRIAIQDLNASYSDAVTRHDVSAFMSLWAEDAVWVHPDLGEITGVSAIWKTIEAAFRSYPMVILRSTIGWLTVDGEAATGSVYIDEVVTTTEGATNRVYGLYDDVYVKQFEHWRFKRRVYRPFYRD